MFEKGAYYWIKAHDVQFTIGGVPDKIVRGQWEIARYEGPDRTYKWAAMGSDIGWSAYEIAKVGPKITRPKDLK